MSQARTGRANARVIVGTSGWRYASWRGNFYPEHLPQRRELEYLSRELATIEINGSFYSLQSAKSYLRWREATPEGFVFGVKGGRYITHMLRMRDTREALANFFASGVLLLGDRLGPVLWQLPERTTFDAELLETFCSLLPATIGQAKSLAADHDEHVERVRVPRSRLRHGIRHALEARHASFDSEECTEVLRRHGIALVTADSGGRWPQFSRVTADFVYVRLHGSPEAYSSGYSRDQLRRWAAKVSGWASGESTGGTPRDVYVYFDNDAKGHAPHDARTLAGFVSES